MIAFPPPTDPAPKPAPNLLHLRAKAQALEAAFLSEMLAHAGLDGPKGAFGGGEGEDHFQSFLRQAQAEAMAKRGGIGLGEQIFNLLKGQANGA